jgi:hypothetical protein
MLLSIPTKPPIRDRGLGSREREATRNACPPHATLGRVGLFDIFSRKEPPPGPEVLKRIADVALQHDLHLVVELLAFLPPPTSPYGRPAALAVKALVDAASPEDVAPVDQWFREPAWSGPRSIAHPSWDAMRLGPLESWARQYTATVASEGRRSNRARRGAGERHTRSPTCVCTNCRAPC